MFILKHLLILVLSVIFGGLMVIYDTLFPERESKRKRVIWHIFLWVVFAIYFVGMDLLIELLGISKIFDLIGVILYVASMWAGFFIRARLNAKKNQKNR